MRFIPILYHYPNQFLHPIKVRLTVDSSGWIVLDAQINVLLDSKPFEQEEHEFRQDTFQSMANLLMPQRVND